jgi:hypothetical protein
MAGTLVITTLSDGTNSTSATNCIQGSAKAWVNFDGTGTPAIRASYNVSSITDNGTGLYTVNLTNAMPDANYCALLSKQNPAGTNMNDIGLFNGLSGGVTVIAPTASSYAIMLNNSQNDSAYVMSAIFR